jgi:glycosyltransferase involved in cell wall biosynthesis
MKTLLVSEEISNQPNEGTLVFLRHLCRFLQRDGELTAVHSAGEPAPDIRALPILASKALYTRELVRLLRNERFDLALYVPRSGLTAAGLARSALLRLLAKAPLIVIGLQHRPVGALHGLFSRLGRVDLVLSPVASVREALERRGVRTDFIMPGFDDRVFRPVAREARTRLRAKYNLPRDRFILLHIGHVRESRNLEIFLRYRDWGSDIQPVIKAGEVDPSWAHRLRLAGIIIIDEYIEAVHELYQAADCYFFPVADRTGAVEFPLSVIEACACNLPVVATRFGIIPDMLGEGDGLRYYDRITEIGERIALVRAQPASTASGVANFSWEMVFRRFLTPHMHALTGTGATGVSR